MMQSSENKNCFLLLLLRSSRSCSTALIFAFLSGFAAGIIVCLYEYIPVKKDIHSIKARPIATKKSGASDPLHQPVFVKLSHSLSEKESFVWPSHQLGIPERMATERPFLTPALSLLDFMNVLSNHDISPFGFFINVGANDACLTKKHECDEANQLLPLLSDVLVEMTKNSDVRRRNLDFVNNFTFQGVLFEPGSRADSLLGNIYKEGSFRLVPTPLDYFNAVNMFADLDVPKDKIDVLKYDTDAMDCEVINAILKAGYQPTIVMAEYNIVYPPPLRFNFMVSPDGTFHWGAKAPNNQQMGNQCSLSYLSDMMSHHGYTLVQVDWWDAFFVRDPLVQILTGGSPLYDDLSWYLHGYVANSPSEKARVEFLNLTAYRKAVQGPAQFWLREIINGSQLGSTEPLDEQQKIRMRTDYWWLAAKNGYVQVKNVTLSSVEQRKICHDGCVPQPFNLS